MSCFGTSIHSPNHGIDTRVTWGLNLGQNNITAAFLEAKSIVKAFSSSAIKRARIVLDSIEIGNEANLYPNNGARPQTYTTAQYVEEWVTFFPRPLLYSLRFRWTAFATNISATMGISANSATKFWGVAFAGAGSSHSTTGFSPQAAINEGLLLSEPGSAISTSVSHSLILVFSH